MKYLIGAICAIVISLAFAGRKCEHVFTEVEQAAVKIERPNIFQGSYYTIPSWPSGLQEGKELICVKCFNVQKQVLDYGKPDAQCDQLTFTADSFSFNIDTCMFLRGSKLMMDKILTRLPDSLFESSKCRGIK